MKFLPNRSHLLFCLLYFTISCGSVDKNSIVIPDGDFPTLLKEHAQPRTSSGKTNNQQRKRKLAASLNNFRPGEDEVVTYNKMIANCSDAPVSGIYQIKFPEIPVPINVRCEASFDSKHGAWMVIQRRIDGTVNFFRNWRQYKIGFGDLETEFFFGLEKIYRITQKAQMEMAVIMKAGNTKQYALYNLFRIGAENEHYRISQLGSYRGTAGDGFSYHRAGHFSTYDKKNDGHADENCAISYQAGWWFRKCYQSNLNGRWTPNKGLCPHCIRWNTLNKDTEVTFVQMMLRKSPDDFGGDWGN